MRSLARRERESRGHAARLYGVVADVAHDWMFRDVKKIDELERVLRGLNQALLAADNIAQVEHSYAE
jgi:hypothetical protein